MNYSLKVDYVGIVAGFLCLVHCLATPFIFIAKSCAITCCANTPSWWHTIDYIFLVISCFAIYHSTKTSQKSWVKIGLWFNWFALLCIVANEKLEIIYLAKEIIYIPSIAIVILHIYNLRYCQCKADKCCTKQIIQ